MSFISDPDTDLGKSFGYDRTRIHNTGIKKNFNFAP
jgi:hypothetical protein